MHASLAQHRLEGGRRRLSPVRRLVTAIAVPPAAATNLHLRGHAVGNVGIQAIEAPLLPPTSGTTRGWPGSSPGRRPFQRSAASASRRRRDLADGQDSGLDAAGVRAADGDVRRSRPYPEMIDDLPGAAEPSPTRRVKRPGSGGRSERDARRSRQPVAMTRSGHGGFTECPNPLAQSSDQAGPERPPAQAAAAGGMQARPKGVEAQRLPGLIRASPEPLPGPPTAWYGRACHRPAPRPAAACAGGGRLVARGGRRPAEP